MLDAYDLKEFYASKSGRFVRNIIRSKINNIWPNVKDVSMMGYGYAFPYLKFYEDKAERIFNFLPSNLGPYHWKGNKNGLNKSAVVNPVSLPLTSECMDLCLTIHGLEFIENPADALSEIWHVLKPNGRLLIAIPNRAGLWSQSDHTPMGQGQPYSLGQLRRILKDENFVIESVHSTLYTPPWRSFLLLKSFQFVENIGPYMPMFSGVYIVEATKQVFSTTPVKQNQKIRLKPFVIGGGITPQPS